MSDKKPKAPQELIEQRPALNDLPHAAQESINGIPGFREPKKYTRAVHDVIVTAIREGNRPQVAAGMAGITGATFYEWVRRGKEGDPALWEFAQDVELAQHEAEGAAVKVIRDAAKMEPELAKWWLERARADGYAKQLKVQVDEAINAFLNRLEAALDPETFHKILAIYAGQYTPQDEAAEPEKPPVH